MITEHSNTLNTLSIEAYKSIGAKVLLIKSIGDTLDRANISLVPLTEYMRRMEVCTPIKGGCRFNVQVVKGYNSSILIPDLRGLDTSKIIKILGKESVILLPPIDSKMPSQPLMVESFINKLMANVELRDVNMITLKEEK